LFSARRSLEMITTRLLVVNSLGIPWRSRPGAVALPPPRPHVRAPATAQEVAPWVAVIERLSDDPAFEAEHRRRALVEAQRWETERVVDQYERFLVSRTGSELAKGDRGLQSSGACRTRARRLCPGDTSMGAKRLSSVDGTPRARRLCPGHPDQESSGGTQMENPSRVHRPGHEDFAP
jgi:hypothetical protein